MKRTKLMLAALSVAALNACATTSPSARFDSFSMTAPAGTLSAYDAVYLAPIAIGEELAARVGYRTKGPSDRIRPLSEKDIARATDRLAEAVSRALASDVSFVDGPGDGVLTIAITLEDLDANRPTQAEMADRPGLSFNSRSLGGAAATVVFSEGVQTLATAEDDNRNRGTLEDASPSIWGDADRFHRQLADKIAGLLAS